MVTSKPIVDDILNCTTRPALKAKLEASRLKLSLPLAQQITSYAQTLPGNGMSVKVGILHTYTSDLLDPWLAFEAAVAGIDLSVYHAPYGVTFQEASENSGLVQHKPDVTLVMLQRRDLHPDLMSPIAGFTPERLEALRLDVVKGVETLVGALRRYPLGQIIFTVLPSMSEPCLGQFDTQAERSEAAWWAEVKRGIGQMFRESLPSTLYLDLDETLANIGRRHFFDLRFWYSSQFPFSAEAARELAAKIVRIGEALKAPKAKAIILDADNTLWGGVIGEDGLTGIGLGPDYPGNCFVDFQRRLLDYQQRGFILALCSKNNLADLNQVLREHPHQVLREEHFAAHRVNWEPKAENIASLAKELNLGLESFIFVDDSSHECEAVRQALPQVQVVQTPSRPVAIPTCLEGVARLEIFSLTAEDLAKTAMYAQERQRREFQEQSGQSDGGGSAEYLRSLGMKMKVSLNPEAHLARLAQLTQKTNQFNLTTRRYDEHQMREFMQSDDCLVADFSLADIFGDSGIVGLAIFRLDGKSGAALDTFLMSCRVIGREAETAFLQTLLQVLSGKGVTEVMAEFLPTAKNGLAQGFLSSQGFSTNADGTYGISLMGGAAPSDVIGPISVTLEI